MPESKPPPTTTHSTDNPAYKAAGKLTNQTAVITGGDSGIGAAVAIAFAKEGAKVAILYDRDDQAARDTADLIHKYGGESLLIQADVGNETMCKTAVQAIIEQWGRITILVNNAGTQTEQTELRDITEVQLEATFRTNIYSMFFMSKAVVPYLGKGDCIITTSSVTAFRGSPELMDYAATKGAITAFTRSLSQNLASKGIRVNSVAPGPIWTPLIYASFSAQKQHEFGQQQPLGRAGEPHEVAPAYVFLASEDATYITGQTIHVNGGEIVNA